DLRHHVGDRRVDVFAGRRATGANADPALSVMIEQGGGHLRAASIVDADEEHFRDFVHDASLDLAERPPLLSGGATDERGDRIGDAWSRARSWCPLQVPNPPQWAMGSVSRGTTTSAANVPTVG